MVLAEASVSRQPLRVFPGRYGSGSGAYRLEISVRYAPHFLSKAEDGGAHTVAPCHVLCPSLKEEGRISGQLFAKGDGIVIITPVRDRDKLDAFVKRLAEPQVVAAVQGDAYHHGNVVV